ncbi:hypothetical protein [Streptomyces zaomyceticus]|nr:hypothetical protein OG237_43510 [Streptomyces zaomyceticus]
MLALPFTDPLETGLASGASLEAVAARHPALRVLVDEFAQRLN